MKNWFDRLNLRPQERRLVVIVGLVVFVLLNMWFVWPYFGDWGKVQAQLQKDRATLARYKTEIARRDEYARDEKKLETTGSEMLTSETEFQRIISSQAAASGVLVSSLTFGKQMTGTRTNQFFQEGSINVVFTSGGKELVDFLVAIAAQNSMIRVREMSIRPDPSQTKLTGTLVFVGNYARPQAVPAAPSTPGRTGAPAPTQKPAAQPASRTPAKNPTASPGKTTPPPSRKNT